MLWSIWDESDASISAMWQCIIPTIDFPTACGLSTTTFNNYTFLFRVLLCSANLLVLVPNYIKYHDDNVNIRWSGITNYGNVNVQQMCACNCTWNCAVAFINIFFSHFMWWCSTTMPCLCFNNRYTLHQAKRPITATHVSHYKWHQKQWTLMQNQQWRMSS